MFYVILHTENDGDLICVDDKLDTVATFETEAEAEWYIGEDLGVYIEQMGGWAVVVDEKMVSIEEFLDLMGYSENEKIKMTGK